MATDRAALVTRYPEFSGAASGMVAAEIAASYALLDDVIFGDQLDEAVLQHAAHNLASGPFGNSAKLTSKDGSTVYGGRFEMIAMAASAGAYRGT